MKKKIPITFALSLLFLNWGWGVVNEDFFNKVKEVNEKNFKKHFSAFLESTVVSYQLENIPKDSIELGKTPELYLKYRKGYAPILVIENVSPFYVNFFSPYESIIQKSGLFLGLDNYTKYTDFAREYKVKIKKITEGYKVTIREKEGLSGDYAEYFYHKNFMIFRAYFYEERKKTGEAKFFYQTIQERNLPKRIIIILHKKLRGGMKEFFVDFTQFNFKDIPAKIF